jgi:hypothetical protein
MFMYICVCMKTPWDTSDVSSLFRTGQTVTLPACNATLASLVDSQSPETLALRIPIACSPVFGTHISSRQAKNFPYSVL